MEVDSDSDDPSFYESTGKEVEDFLQNTEDTVSLRTGSIRTSSTWTSKDDEITYVNSALSLNKQMEDKYKRLEEVLYETLRQIRQKIEENSKAIMSQSNTAAEGFNYIRSGKPYFKDIHNFSAPDNVDTIMMRHSQMYDFSSVSSVPGWTVKDKTELVNALQEISRKIKKDEYTAKIAKLRKQNSPKNDLEIVRLQKEVTLLKKKSLMEIALPLDQEYDWEALTNKLNRRHTAQEYQSLWKLFYHPSINKSNWTKSEHQDLQKIAANHNMQDWEAIAKQLNTGRTGYQCFVYYRTNMTDSSVMRRWTPEEVEYLQRVIEYFREGTYVPWGKVATAMDNRTKIQVYNKYTRMLEHRKGRFLEEEDTVILNCYDKYGVNFKKISEFLPGRSAAQLRTRFNLLTRMRLSTTWTVEDDKKLLQIMANMDSNSNFSLATQHFPGKNRFHLRSRYLTLMKWMKSHPATDLSMAPRRGTRRLVHGHANMSLNEALVKLNKRMEAEVVTKKTGRITRSSREQDIEDAITAAVINEIIREEAIRKPDNCEEGESSSPALVDTAIDQKLLNVVNIRKLLLFLNACLDENKFNTSKYSKLHKGLEDTRKEVSLVKVKSYSRKEAVKTIQLEWTPDIWGNKVLGATKFVLPPNYATITGCRVLMNHVSGKCEEHQEDEINLSLMARKNTYLKDALSTLKDRFTTLFLWPMLLSNESPNNSNNDGLVKQTTKQAHNAPNHATIPLIKKSHLKSSSSSDYSDSEDSDENNFK